MFKKLLLTGLMCLPIVVNADDLHFLYPIPDYVAPQGSKFFTIQEINNIINNNSDHIDNSFWTNLPDKNKDFFLTQLIKYLKNPETENLFTLLGVKSQIVYSHQCPIEMWRTQEHPESLIATPTTFCFGQYQTYSEYKQYMDLYHKQKSLSKTLDKKNIYYQLLYHDTPYLIPETYDVKENNHDISFFVNLNTLEDKKDISIINFNTTKYCISQKDLMKNIKLEFPDAKQYLYDYITLDKEETKNISMSYIYTGSIGCLSSMKMNLN